MAKKHTIRRSPRFLPLKKPVFNLPQRCPPVFGGVANAGFHTYYLSCDPRGLSLYLPHTIKHFHSGFRAVVVAAEGLQFEPPSVVCLGIQNGDTFAHGVEWASSNPLDELHVEFAQQSRSTTLKEQKDAQKRFTDALATLEGVEEARLEAVSQVEAATVALIGLQGVEAIHIHGCYYDASYTREKVYLKRRDARFNPELKSAAPVKKAAKRSSRVA